MGTQQKMTPRPIRNAWLPDPIYDHVLHMHFIQVEAENPRNYFGFMYRWGQEFDHGRVIHYSENTDNACRNAFRAMNRGSIYCEGWAIASTGTPNVARPHAWNLDTEGKIIESTWDSLGARYFGVPFSATFIRSCVQRTGWDGILGCWLARHSLLNYWDDANEIIAT